MEYSTEAQSIRKERCLINKNVSLCSKRQFPWWSGWLVVICHPNCQITNGRATDRLPNLFVDNTVAFGHRLFDKHDVVTYVFSSNFLPYAT